MYQTNYVIGYLFLNILLPNYFVCLFDCHANTTEPIADIPGSDIRLFASQYLFILKMTAFLVTSHHVQLVHFIVKIKQCFNSFLNSRCNGTLASLARSMMPQG